MKKQTRAIAFDDGRFGFRQGRVALVGVIARLPSYIEGAVVTSCEIDGTDATAQVSRAVSESRLREQLRVIFLDGIACGGFNIYDLRRINKDTGLPVISVTRAEPDLAAMEAALRKHFPDWRERYALLLQYRPHPLSASGMSLHLRSEGCTDEEAKDLILASIVRGNYPEPLRIAHIFAGAVSSGESAGKA